MAILVRLHDLVNDFSQFVIATHSPIILAYPDAVIYAARMESSGWTTGIRSRSG